MKAVKGFPDYVDQSAFKFHNISNYLIDIGQKFYCKLALLPIMEPIDLFKRSLGNETDIVQKEMFIFDDKYVLRPEMTASLARCLKYKGIFNGRYMYYGNCFRKERPQKGRYRQFTQFGLEFIGNASETEEMDILLYINTIINQLNLPNLVVKLNTIGNTNDRQKFIKILYDFFEKNYNKLSQEAKHKFDRNAIFRILDSKLDYELVQFAPKITDYVDCSLLNKLLDFSQKIGLNAVIDHTIIRGLDYYNDFVFEIAPINNELAQSSLGGGGRYDGLFSHLGYQNTYGLGFALGIERLIEYMDLYNIEINHNKMLNIGICYNEQIINIIDNLRLNANVILLDLDRKCALNQANKQMLDFVIFSYDISNNIYIIKCMKTGNQKYISYEDLHKIKFNVPKNELLLNNLCYSEHINN